MKMIELNLKPDKKQLRQFGLIAFVAFFALAGLIAWKNGLFGFDFGAAGPVIMKVFLGLGAASGLLALIAPILLLPLYLALMILSYPIGFVISYVLMGILFYGLLTPVGLVFRIIGRDALKRKFDPDASSYYVPHRPVENVSRYYKQF